MEKKKRPSDEREETNVVKKRKDEEEEKRKDDSSTSLAGTKGKEKEEEDSLESIRLATNVKDREEQKPPSLLVNWTRKDTQQWINDNPRFEPLRPVLQNFSGKDLMKLTTDRLRQHLLDYIGLGLIKGEHASLGESFFNILEELKAGSNRVTSEEFLRGYAWNTSNHKKYVTDAEEMPLRFRQDTFKVVENNIQDRRTVWSPNKENRIEHRFLVAAGAPGVGKSRVLQELETRLNTGRKVHTIILSFGNGRAPKQFDEDLTIEASIGIRLLHRLGTEEGTLGGFFEKCNLETDVHRIQAEPVLQAYFDRLNPKKEDMDVVLAIDEFQSLLRSDDGRVVSRVVNVNGEKKERKVSNSLRLLDHLVQLYGGLLLAQPFYKSHNVFLTIIFSGTYLQPLNTVFRESGNIPYKELQFPLLRPPDLQEMVHHTLHLYHPGCNPTQSIEFWKQLLSFGGWPRPTSEFLKRVRAEKTLESIHWQTLTDEVLNDLSEIYTNWQLALPFEILHPMLITSLLRRRLPLVSEPVIPPSSNLDWEKRTDLKSWASTTWEGLARLGLCTLEPIPMVSPSSSTSSSSSSSVKSYHVVLPVAMVIRFLTKQARFRHDNPLWNRVLDQLKATIEYWQQWEVFCCWHEIVRGFLLYLDLNPTGQKLPNQVLVLLHEFFPTPLYHKTLDGIRLDISNSPNTCFERAKHRWPTSGRTIRIANRANVVLNAEGAPCDWFSQGKIQPIKIEGNRIKKVNLTGQAKHTKKDGRTRKTTPLSLESIQKERNKIAPFSGDDTLNVLCIITNRPVAPDVTVNALPKYTLVIHPEVHDAYFGGFNPGALDKIAGTMSGSSIISSSSVSSSS